MLGNSSNQGFVAHIQLILGLGQPVGFGNGVLDRIPRLPPVSRYTRARKGWDELTRFLLDGLDGEVLGVSASAAPWLVSSRFVRWVRLAEGGITKQIQNFKPSM